MSYTDMTTVFGYNQKMLASDWDAMAENQKASIAALTDVGFLAYLSAADQSIVNSGEVVFDVESYDLGGYYNTATGRFTPPVGRYILTATVNMDGTTLNDNTAHGWSLLKNGANASPRLGVIQMRKTESNDRSVAIAMLINQTSASDAWSILAFAGLADTFTVKKGATLTYFGGHRIPAEA